MKLKRFEAADTKTALAMVKRELGEDAVILSTKNLGPAGGSKTSRRIEVVAAVDYPENPPAKRIPPEPSPAPPPVFTVETHREKTTGSQAPALDDCPRATASRKAAAHFIKIMGKKTSGKKAPAGPVSPEPGSGRRPPLPDLAEWRRQLLDSMVSAPIQPDRGPVIIALVGPTGVGKTTTAAKLAAWFSIREELRVTLISTDSYRIGATEQLRTYSKIMRIPCEISLNRKDLRTGISRHRDQDIIIIDTAGKSPYDPDHISELSSWFPDSSGIRPYLTISATAKKEDLRRVITSYAPIKPAGLFLTKLDETRAYAALCREVVASGLPVAGLCCGQRVPEDYLPSSRSLTSTLFGKGWDAMAPYLSRERVCA